MKFEDIMSFHEGNKDNFEEMKKSYDSGSLAPFVGAGLSIPPYLSWRDSLKHICSVVPSAMGKLNDLLKENLFEDAAEFVYEQLGAGRFDKTFRNEFDQNKIHDKGLSKAMKLLPHLFRGPVFTTNYDKCIETAYGRDFVGVVNIRNAESSKEEIAYTFRDQPHYLYKLHGDVDKVTGRVLLKSEYDELYAPNGPFVNVLKDFFVYKRFLFLGCSMTGTDRYMEMLFRAVTYKADNYAILPMLERNDGESDAELNARQEKWETLLSNHYVFPIFYPAGDYDSVVEILTALNPCGEGKDPKEPNHATGFFGREDEIKEIENRLDNYRYVFVHGEGGIGKTQVCEEVVWRFGGDALKVYLQGSTGYASLIKAVSGGLGIDDSRMTLEELSTIIRNKLEQKVRNKGFLLYLDNFEDVMFEAKESTASDSTDDERLPDPAVKWVVDLVRSMPKGFRVLVSTRDYVIGATNYPIKPLGDSETTLLFQSEFQRNGGDALQLNLESDKLAKLVHELLCGMPLATVLAASQAAMDGSVLRVYEEWKKGNTAVQAIAPDGNPTHAALKTAFFVSYNHLRGDEAAKKLWGFLALVPNALSSELGECLLPGKFHDASKKLRTLSLARWGYGNELRMLAPIKQQAFCYDENLKECCLEELTGLYCDLIYREKIDFLSTSLVGDIAFFLDYLVENIGENRNRIMKVWKKPSKLHYLACCRSLDFLYIYDKIIGDEGFFGSLDGIMKAEMYVGRGRVLFMIGLEEKAVGDYESAMGIFEAIGENKRLAKMYVLVGEAKGNLHDYQGAVECYENAQRLYMALHKMADACYCGLEIGNIHFREGEKERGIDEMRYELNRVLECHADQHMIANSEWTLANALVKQNKYDEALEFLVHAEKIYLSEKDVIGLGNCYQDLGKVYEHNHDIEKALDFYRKAQKYFSESQIETEYYGYTTRRISTISRIQQLMSSDEMQRDDLL